MPMGINTTMTPRVFQEPFLNEDTHQCLLRHSGLQFDRADMCQGKTDIEFSWNSTCKFFLHCLCSSLSTTPDPLKAATTPSWLWNCLESLAYAENWFPVKVSPVRKGARIKVLLKETQGIFLAHNQPVSCRCGCEAWGRVGTQQDTKPLAVLLWVP